MVKKDDKRDDDVKPLNFDAETLDADVKALKNLGEVLDKLKNRRKEIKQQLLKELADDEEAKWAAELSDISNAINRLDVERRRLIDKLGR